MLVFLPGIGEILRCRDRLQAEVGSDVDVRPLAGALTTAEQDLALAPSPPGRRRVVLATDIAETSLTVDGVRVVVDSGLARAPRFDPGTGMTRLTTVSISRDSADQRAGRAGRTEPGAAYRLWSRIEHGRRPAHRAAEIASVDLAGLALDVAAWGTPVDALAFLQAPPARAWREAMALLRLLDAVDEDGRPTEVGRRMLALPLHPRLARMVAAAPTTTSCLVATVVDERDVLRGRVDELPADLGLRVALVAGHVHDDRADRARAAPTARSQRRSGQAGRCAFRPGGRRRRCCRPPAARRVPRPPGGASAARPVPAAHGNVGVGRRRRSAGAADFVVAADLDGRRDRARIRLAAPVDAVDITSVLHDVAESRRLLWDSSRDDLVLRIERRLDALSLGEEIRPPDPGDATVDALIDRVRATRLAVLDWTPSAVQLRARVAFLAASMGGTDGGWPDLSDRALLASLDTWLRPYLVGATGRSDLERVDVTTLLRALLPSPLGADLDSLAPEAWTLPGGGRVAIDYTADRPTASVRVQDVFGVVDHPRLAGGRVPLTLALLSPADRPIQVTADLPGFWAGSWAAVRKELAGRYPKHRWPADPAGERPGRLKPR